MGVSHFLFVPGPLDPWGSTMLPRPPLPLSFTARLRAKVPRTHFTSNPCRIKFFGQEIVIMRQDLMDRMLANLIGVKPDLTVTDTKRYVCASFPGASEMCSLLVRILSSACANYHRPMPSLTPATLRPTHQLATRLHITPVPDAYHCTYSSFLLSIRFFSSLTAGNVFFILFLWLAHTGG